MTNPVQIKESLMCGNKRVQFHLPNRRPSWKRYGDGVANAEFTFYGRANSTLGISIEETYFANSAMGETRDVTKSTMIELDRAAAEKLYSMLGEMLGKD